MEKFEARYNGDLANGLGNFAARVLTLASDAKLQINVNDSEITNEVNTNVSRKIQETAEIAAQKLEEFKLNEALEALWSLIHFGDRYVNEKKPWDKSLSEADKINSIYNAVIILDNIAGLLSPFLPEVSGKITRNIIWEKGVLKIKKGEALFPRL